MDAALKDSIKQVMIEQLDLRGRRPSDIEDDAPLFGAGLGLDSLDALQLAMAIEERFGVTVPEGEAGRATFASVNAIAEFIARARGG
jgi:acyl carrier protein